MDFWLSPYSTTGKLLPGSTGVRTSGFGVHPIHPVYVPSTLVVKSAISALQKSNLDDHSAICALQTMNFGVEKWIFLHQKSTLRDRKSNTRVKKRRVRVRKTNLVLLTTTTIPHKPGSAIFPLAGICFLPPKEYPAA